MVVLGIANVKCWIYLGFLSNDEQKEQRSTCSVYLRELATVKKYCRPRSLTKQRNMQLENGSKNASYLNYLKPLVTTYPNKTVHARKHLPSLQNEPAW